ncbi:hypothetical protein ACU4GD_32435 [Cupriavidus basilensis]
MQLLPRETLALLTALSCLGSAVSSATAAQAWGASAADIASLLAHAIAAGHVVPGENGYHFSHDRVQEVAYGAIPAADRAALHLRLARRLAQRLDRDAGSSLFEAIDQFNRAADAITDDGERIEVAALNRDAGHRAMRTTAYGAASACFAAGERLLPRPPGRRTTPWRWPWRWAAPSASSSADGWPPPRPPCRTCARGRARRPSWRPSRGCGWPCTPRSTRSDQAVPGGAGVHPDDGAGLPAPGQGPGGAGIPALPRAAGRPGRSRRWPACRACTTRPGAPR